MSYGGTYMTAEPYPDAPVVCRNCKGIGYFIYSCCGVDVTDTITENSYCPKCGEHIDGEDKEICEICDGFGVVNSKR